MDQKSGTKLKKNCYKATYKETTDSVFVTNFITNMKTFYNKISILFFYDLQKKKKEKLIINIFVYVPA